MALMNPYYVRPSEVGDVVDVATWSSQKAIGRFLLGLIGCAATVAAAAFVWDPEIFLESEPKDIAQAREDYGWAFQLGLGALGLFAYWCLTLAVSSMVVFFHPSYFFRAGPGGLSVRVPNGPCLSTLGFTVNVLEFDMSWDEIERWWFDEEHTIAGFTHTVHERSPLINVQPVEGAEFDIPTDYFRESPEMIVSKIRDAPVMEVPTFGEETYAET